MSVENLISLAQYLGGAVAVYAAIRADMAAMRVRIAHLERAMFGAPINAKESP